MGGNEGGRIWVLSATLSIPALSLHAGKNTWDDSELEQSGLHSAVRFLSAVLALRASLIPAFFLFFLSACSFIVVSVLFIWVYFSLRPGCKADPNEISFTLKSIRNGPIIPTTSIRGGFPPPGPKHTGWCDYPKSKFFFFFYIFCFWYMLRIFFFLSDRLEDFVFGHGFKLRNPGSYIGKSLW